MKKYILSLIMFIGAFPYVAFAAAVTDVNSLFTLIGSTMKSITPMIVGLAVLYFIWGVLSFVMNSGDEDAQKAARSQMLYGIIAIFVMVSVWGLVGILSGTFGFTNQVIDAPTLPTI